MVTQLERGKKGLCAVLTIFESIRHLAIIRRFVKSVTKVEHALYLRLAAQKNSRLKRFAVSENDTVFTKIQMIRRMPFVVVSESR